MVLLFKPEHIQPILRGEKTQTRRAWKRCLVKVGSVRRAKTKRFSTKYFALLKITGIRRERLGNISEADAKAEGYRSIEDFRRVWSKTYAWDPNRLVYVVDFEVAKDDHSLRT